MNTSCTVVNIAYVLSLLLGQVVLQKGNTGPGCYHFHHDAWGTNRACCLIARHTTRNNGLCFSLQAEPVLQAAGVLSALAVAEPSSAALLLQECLEKLASQVQPALAFPHQPRPFAQPHSCLAVSQTKLSVSQQHVFVHANATATQVPLPCPRHLLCPKPKGKLASTTSLYCSWQSLLLLTGAAADSSLHAPQLQPQGYQRP